MKKLALIAVVAGFAFASCKKDYTCSCTGSGLPDQYKSTSISNAKKKDAKSACDSYETQLKGLGFSDASCSI